MPSLIKADIQRGAKGRATIYAHAISPYYVILQKYVTPKTAGNQEFHPGAQSALCLANGRLLDARAKDVPDTRPRLRLYDAIRLCLEAG